MMIQRIVSCISELRPRVMKEYLWYLIDRMNEKGKCSNSSHDPAWLAHRKAEKLNNPEYLPLLREIVLDQRGKEKQEIRGASYFIMGKLLAKRPETEYIAFFIDQIRAETDPWVRSRMLDRIAEVEIPLQQPMETIIAMTMDDRWQVRNAAIRALGSQNSERCRELLRDFVALQDHKTHSCEIVEAQAALMKIGGAEDIDLIEKNLHSRVKDIRESAAFVANALREKAKDHES